MKPLSVKDCDKSTAIVHFYAYFHYAIHYGVYQKAELLIPAEMRLEVNVGA